MEEKYALYVLEWKIPPEEFWHLPLGSLEQIVQCKQAFDGWKNNPRTNKDKLSLDGKLKEIAKEKFGKEGEADGGEE